MTVGFHLNYQRTDECFTALQLARALEQLGHDVSILPAGKAGVVDAHWDGRVLRGGKKDYLSWLSGLSHVVFAEAPPPEMVLSAQSGNVRSVLLLQWNTLTERDIQSAVRFDKVIAPSRSVYKHLRAFPAFDGVDVSCVPWDVVSPFTRSDHVVDPTRIGIAWDLNGSQAFVQDSSSLGTLRELLKLPYVYATVLHEGRLLRQHQEALAQLHQAAEGRLELLKSPSWERRMLTLAAHDFTIWPSLSENAGLVGLMSLTVGTPVVAYDHPVCGEVVRDSVNGILVPCELEYNWFCVPSAVPNEPAFLEQAMRLACSPSLVTHLRGRAHHKLDKRRRVFQDQICTIFDS